MKKTLIILLAFISLNTIAQPITDGLVGYWPFNGNANDESGNENGGYASGAILSTDRNENANSAYRLDGINDYITVGINNINPTQGSIAMWIKPETAGNLVNAYVLFDTWSSQGSNQNERIILWKGNAGTAGTNIICGVDVYNLSEFNISHWLANEWHHVVMVWRAKNDGSDFVKLYIDGQKVVELSFQSINISSNSNTAMIGRHYDPSLFVFKGTIDDVMLFNKSITQEEVSLIYNDSPVVLPPIPDNPINYNWHGNGSAIYYNDGSIGIGTSTPPDEFKLAVAGKILAEEIQVKLQSNWPDYVFSTNYNLPTLEEVENFIIQNKHLPEIPNTEKVQEEGIGLGEMNARLLQKIEEHTLYLIEINKEMQALKKKNIELEEKVSKLEK